MGTKYREIIKVDADKLIKMLNSAFADEWLAYYQYWVGSKVVKGPMKSSVITELDEHATEELRHAQMLSDRIIQLGGSPILEPSSWYDHSGCGYAAPTDAYVEDILRQNINGEQCAIEAYNRIADFTRDKDPITYNLAVEIMRDEVEHEEDLQSLLEDIQLMKSR
jgi:bacterioferritin